MPKKTSKEIYNEAFQWSRERLKEYAKDIFTFIEDARQLTPQLVKPQYEELLLKCRKTWEYNDMRLTMFQPFFKWRHITRQQAEFFHSINDAVNWRGPKKITVRSWHGIGKTWSMSILLLRWLVAHLDAQVPCTAPTQTQLRDVLRKELAVRYNKMPDRFKDQFEYSSEYIRSTSRPKERFARARTWGKESPEALAWVHGPFVMLLVDEASGVFEEVFNVSQWALTNENTLMIMISNPTRLTWYFFDSHTKYKKTFRALHFNSEESPIVTAWFVASIIDEHGEDSEEYAIRVRGEFPNSENADDDWWKPLFSSNDFRQVLSTTDDFTWYAILWVDPSWEWDDETSRVVRDAFIGKLIAKEKISTPKGIAAKTIEIATRYWIPAHHIVIDDFWVWSDTVKELSLAWWDVLWLYLWKPSRDTLYYLNKRAELFDKAKRRLTSWGELVRNEAWKELFTIYYRRVEQSNLMAIMPKERMKKKYRFKSPNTADAFMLTFEINLSTPKRDALLCNRSQPNAWQSDTKSILKSRYSKFFNVR